MNKGDELAIGTPVLSVSLPHQTENLQGSPTIDAHVADLFARSSTELSEAESSQLCDLLIQYGDVFPRAQKTWEKPMWWHIKSTLEQLPR